MGENRRPISATDGHIYIDGIEVAGACKFTVVYTPDVWEGKSLGERGKNRKWKGRDITGTITEWKSTNWLRQKVEEYEKNGRTPELTLQGIRNDKDSDFYDSVGVESITLKGVVLTGDIPLMSLDSAGDVVQDEVSFGAKTLV